jgi:hypothetical protein
MFFLNNKPGALNDELELACLQSIVQRSYFIVSKA